MAWRRRGVFVRCVRFLAPACLVDPLGLPVSSRLASISRMVDIVEQVLGEA